MLRDRRKAFGRLFGAIALAALCLAAVPGILCAQTWGWETATVDQAGEYTSLAVDSAGNLHLSYLNPQEGIKYAFRPAGSSQWFTMVLDHYNGYSNMSTGIALDRQGNPHICYSPSKMKYAYWDGQKWHTEEVAPNSGLIAYTCSIALAPDGTPHLVWYQVDYGGQVNYLHLRHAVRRDGAWLVRTLDFDAETGKWNSMRLDSKGDPHISYSAYHEGLKYASWDGKNWIVQMVDARGQGGSTYRGMGNGLTLDKNGNALISYFDIDQHTLKFARQEGTRWVVQTLDSVSPSNGTGWVAWHSSVALDAQGFPHVIYGDYGSLKHAYWDGKQWHVQVIASGQEGQYRYSAVVVGPDNTLYVSYQDGADGALKFATGHLQPLTQTADAQRQQPDKKKQ